MPAKSLQHSLKHSQIAKILAKFAVIRLYENGLRNNNNLNFVRSEHTQQAYNIFTEAYTHQREHHANVQGNFAKRKYWKIYEGTNVCAVCYNHQLGGSYMSSRVNDQFIIVSFSALTTQHTCVCADIRIFPLCVV